MYISYWRSKHSSTLDPNLLKQGKSIWENKGNKHSENKYIPPDIQMPYSHDDNDPWPKRFVPPSFSPPRITGPVNTGVYHEPKL